MFRKAAGFIVLASLALVMLACAPAATPTAAPTKAPAAAPTAAAQATKPAATATTAPAATATRPAPSPTMAPTTLKFAYVEVLSNAPVFIAMERGYFKEQGITIELVPVQSTGTAFPTMGTGQLDFTVTSLGPALMNAVERGVDLRIIADAGRSQPNWEFIWFALRKDLADSGVKSAADLKGMKLGITSKGSMSELSVQLLLEKEGLKPDHLEMVVTQITDQMAAMANKSLAAGYMLEPTMAQAVRQGLVTKWKPLSSLHGGSLQASVLLIGTNMMKNKDLGQRFMTGYLKGVRDYVKAFGPSKQGRADVVNIVTKYSSVKDVPLYDLMEMPYMDVNGDPDMKSLGIQYDFYVQQGMYTGKLNYKDVIDTSYASFAAQKLGRQ